MKFISEEDISRIKQKVANGQTGAKSCDENQRKVSVIVIEDKTSTNSNIFSVSTLVNILTQ